MSTDRKILSAALALGVAFMIAGCDQEKSSSKGEQESSATEAVKDAATAASEKAQEAAEATKEAAAAVAEKAEEAASAVKDAAEKMMAPAAEKPAEEPAAAAEQAPAESQTTEAAPATEAPAEAAPAAEAPAESKTAEATPAAEAPAATSSEPDNDPTNPDNADVRARAKELGLEWKDGRYRDKDGHPAPVVTKDYKVDWAVWQGFRRYHDACHVCHGPNAGGSTFAPSLAESLKTMDYETFFGVVVGGRVTDRAGTTYVMPAFGEDKNIMCYLDDIYSYIKARSTDAMPPGRPAARQDISSEARKAGTECFGEDQTGGGTK